MSRGALRACGAGGEVLAKRGKRGRRRTRKRSGGRSRLQRFVRASAWLLAFLAVGGGFVAGRYLTGLDRIVRARFEGVLFRVPSRVLSAPTMVYPGLDWKRIDLRGTLARIGYREDEGSGPLAQGSYRWGAEGVRVHRRAFAHPSRAEPARDVRLRLGGSRLKAIQDVESGRELPFLLLEPELVGSYFGPDREQRELVHAAEVPPHLIDAILAVEDQRFHSHHGIDPWRIGGAMLANLRTGRVIEGGSTLTQQLVKNFFLTPERSLKRKAQEALMALIVEARYDKEAILESYLNEIYLGQRGATAIHGVGEASRLYFGKSVQEISVSEAALLAAIIKSPNGRSPYRHPEEARERRDLVLRLMHEQGRLEDGRFEASQQEPLGLAAVNPTPREGRWFLDALRHQLPEFYGAETLTSEGLRIYSTVDLRLQRIAADALRDGLAELESAYPALADSKKPGRLQGCVVALRPSTGEVLAMVGGRDYGETQFNRCTQARRQVGSAFKPFVYLAALEPVDGGPLITLASHLDDAPLSVPTSTGPWQPQNYDREFHGEVSVDAALSRSLNVATARLGQEVGAKRIAAVATRLGIESSLPLVPSLALGAADLAPIEVARAYATIASGGVRRSVRTFEDIVDASGERVDRQSSRTERVLDKGTAFLTTSLLAGVVDHGTGRRVRAAGIVGPVAGKTGTTNDERDAWFAGFTPEMVVVVWVGFDEPRSIVAPASRAALPIWVQFVKESTGGQIPGRFAPPEDVERLDVDPETGALALAGCPRREPFYFIRGTGPEVTCPRWFPGLPRPWNKRQEEEERRGVPGFIDRLFDSWLGRQ